MSFDLKPTKPFIRKYKKFVKGNLVLKKRIGTDLDILRDNPQEPKLKSHKVTTTQFGEVWSIRITGDICILWDYDENNQLVLLLLDIGGHDQVYR